MACLLTNLNMVVTPWNVVFVKTGIWYRPTIKIMTYHNIHIVLNNIINLSHWHASLFYNLICCLCIQQIPKTVKKSSNLHNTLRHLRWHLWIRLTYRCSEALCADLYVYGSLTCMVKPYVLICVAHLPAWWSSLYW